MQIYSPFPGIEASGLDILQVNLGRLCNQSCRHCHLASGPERKECMEWDTQRAIVSVLERHPIETLDLTGGSPELNPTFRDFVSAAAAVVPNVKVRTNLTVLTEPEQADLPEFFAERTAELVASMPCYTQENVDAVRGNGAYGKSIAALKRLNGIGYGVANSGLSLTLVYNPAGPALPGPQAELEDAYRHELGRDHGIEFSRLITITNMPIGRFEEQLRESGDLEDYWDLLVKSHNPEAVAHVMCRVLLSVAWDGRLYDCDFNQALDLRLGEDVPQTIWEFDYAALSARPIKTATHCYGCTAGAGSGCMGSLVAS
ncbi:MAG: arsenosugar biosynthesis radical SAM protein ArsS [Armatimonadota bacterium]|nr:MAG: arsenosugar biosynthesis radical SAM protein ArsS [Armatimonadota bacterium]